MKPNDLGRELFRKAWHLLLLIYLVVFLLAGRDGFLPWMCAWTFLVFVVETLRIRSPGLNRVISRPFALILRERELAGYSGVIYTSLGILAAAAAYGHKPAIVSGAVLSLALADSAAALVGMAWGRLRFTVLGQSRSLEGAAAGFMVSCGCGLSVGLGWPASLAGAGAVTAVDCLPVPPDDNLWIPIAFAAASAAAAGVPPAWPW